MADIIQIRRGTAASATAANPILADGELGIETDTRKGKLGDGLTPWNSLPYVLLQEQELGGGGADVKKYAEAYYHNGYSSNQADHLIDESETVYVPLIATVFMKGDHTLKALRMHQVGGGASIQLRFGLYSSENDGGLALVSDLGFVTLTGLAAFELTTNANMAQGKLYYIAIKFNNAPGTVTQVTGISGNHLGAFGVGSSDVQGVHQGLRKPSTAGLMPATDTLPTTTTARGNVHLIYKMAPTA